MNASDFSKGMRVAYVPLHAHGDLSHNDVETGQVSSVNAVNVFVKFDKQLMKFGWEGTTSQSCDPNSLVQIFEHQTPRAVVDTLDAAKLRVRSLVSENLQKIVALLVI